MALRRRVRPGTEGMWVGMEIERGTAVLWRGPGVVQIGSDPDHHLVLGGLSPAEQVWLVEAARAATPTVAHTTPTPRPSRRRAAPGRAPTPVAARVAAHLRARGVLPHTAAPGPRPNQRMRIDGVDVISAATARILVRSGVERLDIVDPGHSRAGGASADVQEDARRLDDTLPHPQATSGLEPRMAADQRDPFSHSDTPVAFGSAAVW